MERATLQDSDISSTWGDTLASRIGAVQERLGSVVERLAVRRLAEVVSKQVGRAGYVSYSTVQRWLDGKLAPDAYEIAALAKLGGVTVERMMEGLPAPAAKRKRKPVRMRKTEKGGGVEHPTRPARRRATGEA